MAKAGKGAGAGRPMAAPNPQAAMMAAGAQPQQPVRRPYQRGIQQSDGKMNVNPLLMLLMGRSLDEAF